MFAEIRVGTEVLTVMKWDTEDYILRITDALGRVVYQAVQPDFVTACEEAAGLADTADHAGTTLANLLWRMVA